MAFSVSVPNVPGVPAVNFSGLVGDVVSLLVGDALSLFAGVIQAPWGIYLGALPVIPADNVVNFSFEQGYTISDYPIEGGLFQSYDKVQFPFTAGFRFTRGGSFTDRQALLDAISALIGNTLLYNVVTPDAVYLNVTFTKYAYQRAADTGLGLLIVDVETQQVRVSPAAILTNVIDAASASQVNGGTVQTTAPTSAQTSAIPAIDGS